MGDATHCRDVRMPNERNWNVKTKKKERQQQNVWNVSVELASSLGDAQTSQINTIKATQWKEKRKTTITTTPAWRRRLKRKKKRNCHSKWLCIFGECKTAIRLRCRTVGQPWNGKWKDTLVLRNVCIHHLGIFIDSTAHTHVPKLPFTRRRYGWRKIGDEEEAKR